MRMFRYLAVTLAFCISACSAGMAVAAVNYDEKNHSLTIDGETGFFQYLMVKGVLETQEVDTIYMSGPGGALYYGFEIGALIQAEGAMVIIPQGKTCASACAFAAMAADYVFAHGDLLIHRPYIPYIPTEMSLDEYGGFLGTAYLDSQLYLLDMGYPADFMKFIVQETSPTCLLSITGPDVAINMRDHISDGDPSTWWLLFGLAGDC